MALEAKLSTSKTIQIIFNIYCLWLNMANARILVYRRINNQLIEEYNDMPAQFGNSIPSNGLKVFAITANLKYACDPIKPPPIHENDMGYPPNAKYAAIIERGGANCTFETKVRNAQAANFSVAIIYNNEGDDLEHMSAKNASGIVIPSFFVGLTTGESLKSFNTAEIVLVINDELPFNINTQLILPFSILIGLCFLVMIFYMVYKCIREERRLRRYRLPKRLLKKLPIIKYTTKNNDLVYDTCVICLDDFAEGDKLRVLPCKHPYHSDCIDTWLTQNKRDCPICKRKVFTKGGLNDRQREDRQLFDGVTDTDDDTTPLLQQTNRSSVVTAVSSGVGSTRHGTFRRDSTTGGGGGGSGDGGGVVTSSNDATTDDEMMIAAERRINPFDRTPNLPPHLVAQLNTNINRRSIWSWPIFRVFRRNPGGLSIAAPPYHDDVLSDDMSDHRSGIYISSDDNASVAAPIMTGSQQPSNNIVNPNLSGSFKSAHTHENDNDNDSEPPLVSIYEPLFNTIESSNTPHISVQTQTAINNLTETDSVFIQTPTRGGLGVPALPSHDYHSVQRNRPRDTYRYFM